MNHAGIVYIVGAGPGDPGLITVKGLHCLRNSDVVIHDRLVHPSLLEQVRPGAEVINVGKQPGKSHQMQQWINMLLVDRAASGHTVCRLKGGDPFVFGRGAEEARVLANARIRFEIVSGVSSISAVPASVGIPLTDRRRAHGFMVITACHAVPGSEDWTVPASFVRSGGTLVILMGLTRLGYIASTLRALDCPEWTPAAVISNGTRWNQEFRLGSLRDIGVKASSMEPPAMIIVGSAISPPFRTGLAETSNIRAEVMPET